MPTLSATDLAWLTQRHGAEPGIWLMTIVGPEVGVTRRFARSPIDIVSRSETYLACWFDFEEPGDSEELPVARLTLPNVDREVGLAIEENTGAITADFEMVRDSTRDTVVAAFLALRARVASIDPLTVTFTLSAARYDDEPYNPLRISPAHFAGLYL